MRPDQMPRQATDIEDCLGVPVAEMSNAELADAIKYAFECCSATYIGGERGSDTDTGKLMLDHLRELTAAQAARANVFRVPPNSQDNPHPEGASD